MKIAEINSEIMGSNHCGAWHITMYCTPEILEFWAGKLHIFWKIAWKINSFSHTSWKIHVLWDVQSLHNVMHCVECYINVYDKNHHKLVGYNGGQCKKLHVIAHWYTSIPIYNILWAFNCLCNACQHSTSVVGTSKHVNAHCWVTMCVMCDVVL